jgi:tryptophan 2,3-dioxygenase
MSGLRKYWEGGTKDSEGKLHIAQTEFDRRYGNDIASWFERYRDRNLAVKSSTITGVSSEVKDEGAFR